MPNNIVLKDNNDSDVVYKLVKTTGDVQTYVARQGETLLGSSELQIRLTRRSNVNRVYAKLSLPVVCVLECGKTTVSYTEVGSLDLSSVLQAPEDVRQNFVAQFASLAGSQNVAAAFVDGLI